MKTGLKFAWALLIVLAVVVIATPAAYAQAEPAPPDGGILTWTLAQWSEFFKAVTAFIIAIVGIVTPLWLSIRGTLNKNTATTATNTVATVQNTVETASVKQTVAENTLDRAAKNSVSNGILSAIAEKQGITLPAAAPLAPVLDATAIAAIADAVAARQAAAAAAAVLPLVPRA